MGFLKNNALWVMLSGIGVFWLSVFVIGSDVTRDALDLIAMFIGGVLTFRYLPHAWERFKQGGSQSNWQLLMGMTLFWASIFASRAWAFSVRYYDRPQWMVDSPLNGFWTLCIVGAGALCLSASLNREFPIPQTRFYYLALGVAAGIIIGVGAGRLLGGSA